MPHSSGEERRKEVLSKESSPPKPGEPERGLDHSEDYLVKSEYREERAVQEFGGVEGLGDKGIVQLIIIFFLNPVEQVIVYEEEVEETTGVLAEFREDLIVVALKVRVSLPVGI